MSLRKGTSLSSMVLVTGLMLSGCTIDKPTGSASGPKEAETSTVTLTQSSTPSSGEGNENAPGRGEPGGPPEQGRAPGVAEEIPADDDGGLFQSQLQAAVDQTVANYGGSAGIAFSDGSTTTGAGDLAPAAAWSTIKVPLAIAALRVDPAQGQNATAAIQWSDNNAAEALWISLGAPDQAGSATGSVIAEAGTNIAVQTAVTRDGFSSFGQTMWGTADQAQFAANLGCVAGGAPVMQSMGLIDASQSWGIGQLPNAQFKGGWGPQPDGSYSARQFGLTTDPVTGQKKGLALIVRPGSGSFSDATSMANTLISNVQPAVPTAPPSVC